MAQIPDNQLISVERTLRCESRVYDFASKLNSLICWTLVHVGFPTQNTETSHLPSLAPSPVRRWYIPPTRACSDYLAPPSPGHALLRGYTLVGDFRPRATPLPAVSDLLARWKNWNIVRKREWPFSTLSYHPACDVMDCLVAFDDYLISLERQVFKALQGPMTRHPIVFALVLVLCATTFMVLSAPFRRTAIASARTFTCGNNLDSIREVYGADTIVCAVRGGPTTLAHGGPRLDDTVLPLRDGLLGLITYVPCPTYSVLLFVNANQIYKRPIVQNADNPSESPAPQEQIVERLKTEDEKPEGQEAPVETSTAAKGERTRKARRGKRGGVLVKKHQAKRLEWQKAWKRAVDTWGSGAWLEKRPDEEIEMTVD